MYGPLCVGLVCALINSRNMEIWFYKITKIRASGLNWKFFLLSSSEISIRSKTMGGRGHYTGSVNIQKEKKKFIVQGARKMILRFSEPMVDTVVTSQNKVPFDRKAWGLRPKSHMILTVIKKVARNLKRIQIDQMDMASGPIISCFSVEHNIIKNQ